MIYLLDVNALMSLIHREHVFHEQVTDWASSLSSTDRLATCSISELGVARILPQLPDSDFSVEEVQALLAALKKFYKPSISVLADDLGADALPKWVKNPSQTTDGHLIELAKKHGAKLATLDRRIHGAFLIP